MRVLFTLTAWMLFQLIHAQQLPARYYKSLGTVNYYEGNFLDAVYALQKAIALDPADREAHQLLATVYDSVGDKNLSQKTRVRMQALKVSFSRNSPEVEVPALKNDLRALGNDYYNRGLYDSAVFSYTLHLKSFKDDTAALFFLANSYFYLSDYQNAIEHYEQLLSKDRQRADVYNLLGVCNKSLKDYMKARDYFRQCLIKDENYAVAYFNLGETHFALEDYRLAEVNFEKAYRQLPNDKAVMLMLAKSSRQNQRHEKAADVLRTLLLRDSTLAPASFELGQVYFESKRFADAAKCFQQSLRHDSNPSVLMWLGNSLFELKDYVAAFPNLKSSADAFPERKELQHKTAFAANATKQFATAEAYAMRAIKIDGNYKPAYEQLVEACKGLKRKKDVKKYSQMLERM